MDFFKNLNIIKELEAVLQYSPRIFLIFGILGYLATGKLGFLLISAYVIATEIIVNVLKNLFKNSNLPANLINRPSNGDCGAAGYTVSNIGMPSGHTAVAAMFAVYFIVDMIQTGFTVLKMARAIILISIVFGVMYSRVEVENCHTWPQALAGLLIGGVLGLVFWKVGKLPVVRRFSGI